MIPWILIAIAVLIIVLALVAVIALKNNKEHKTDYYTFFILGITWIALGVPLKNPAFSIMGVVFAIIGLKNKDKWKENRQTWDKLDDKQKKLKSWILVILGVLLLVGAIVFYFFQR